MGTSEITPNSFRVRTYDAALLGGIAVKELIVRKRPFLGMIRFSSQKLIAKEQLYVRGKEADADAPEGEIADRVFA
jgi:hypothetical protein